MAHTDPNDRLDFWRDLDTGWAMTAELLTATFVWGGIGWLLDTYVLHTDPWLMVGGFILGFHLGMYRLYLQMQEDGRVQDERRAALWRPPPVDPPPAHPRPAPPHPGGPTTGQL